MPTSGPDTVEVRLAWGEYVPKTTNEEVEADASAHVRETES